MNPSPHTKKQMTPTLFQSFQKKISQILSLFVSIPIHLYRIILSPLLPPSCRYMPSCSTYALEALKIHGTLKGSWLTLRRLARCHPWGGAGYDPVPQLHTHPEPSPNPSEPSHAPKSLTKTTHPPLQNPTLQTKNPERLFRTALSRRFHHQQNGVSVVAEPLFLFHDSLPEEGRFVWQCDITLHNNSDSPLRLINHKWSITGSDGSHVDTHEEHSTSQQPVLIRGAALFHSCTVPMTTPSAFISGSYDMLNDQGQLITVKTPTFSLDSPWNDLNIN